MLRGYKLGSPQNVVNRRAKLFSPKKLTSPYIKYWTQVSLFFEILVILIVIFEDPCIFIEVIFRLSLLSLVDFLLLSQSSLYICPRFGWFFLKVFLFLVDFAKLIFQADLLALMSNREQRFPKNEIIFVLQKFDETLQSLAGLFFILNIFTIHCKVFSLLIFPKVVLFSENWSFFAVELNTEMANFQVFSPSSLNICLF